MENKTTVTPAPKKKKLVNIKEGIKKLPDKKPHLDFIGAFLTIPVLLTVIYINFQSIKGKPNTTPAVVSPTQSPNPTHTIEIHYITNPVNYDVTPVKITTTPFPTQSNSCIPDIGPIAITSPAEGTIVTTNPVCIDINYQSGNYCSVVWAYKINGSALSDYSNNSVCLYNLPQGQNVFELDVKSLSSASTQTLHRTFIYQGPQPTTAPTSTIAPTSVPTPTNPASGSN